MSYHWFLIKNACNFLRNSFINTANIPWRWKNYIRKAVFKFFRITNNVWVVSSKIWIAVAYKQGMRKCYNGQSNPIFECFKTTTSLVKIKRSYCFIQSLLCFNIWMKLLFLIKKKLWIVALRYFFDFHSQKKQNFS